MYRLPNGRILAITGVGGMLDEDEDHFFSHRHTFQNFELWFEVFRKEQGDFWIHFYPMFIHGDVKPVIAAQVYMHSGNDDDIDSKAYWYNALFERRSA